MQGSWNSNSHALKRDLAASLDRERLRELHRLHPWHHFAILARQLLLFAAAAFGAATLSHPLLWLPCSVVVGFIAFNFTVLLHEVVHDAVIARQQPWLKALLGNLYAFPSGISCTQFTRWHLDHHAELGSATGDPKRHHLSPKRNLRWLKLAYFTPCLFFIYFRAAARESRTYPPAVRARIARERGLTIAGHLVIALGIGLAAGSGVLMKAYLIPYLLVFPVAFALNRLGQHYDIDPSDPTRWSTLIKGNRFWDVAYLFSSYHLEHHYFPNVPMYNLPALQRELADFYVEHGVEPRSYAGLAWDYLVRNRAPHTNWAREPESIGETASARS